MNAAEKVFEEKTGRTLLCHKGNTIRIPGPDVFKYDTSMTLLLFTNVIYRPNSAHLIICGHPKPNWL